VRYLFIDDGVIETRASLRRTCHSAAKHPHNPILVAERAWEGAVVPYTVLFDDRDGIFRLWYGTFARVPAARGTFVTCYATSTDGIHWERPDLGHFDYEGSRRNNLCLLDTCWPTVVQDGRDADPARRYKALYWGGAKVGAKAATDARPGAGSMRGIHAAFSADGTHWVPHKPVLAGTGDTVSLYGWDERYGTYVAYVRPLRDFPKDSRKNVPRRVIGRSESADFVRWTEPVTVLGPDAADPPMAELYQMYVSQYQEHYLGFLHVFVPSPDPFGPFWPELAASRDGIRWQRLGHRPFIPLGEPGSFDAGMIWAAQGMLEVDDELWFYYGGWREDHGTSKAHRRLKSDRTAQRQAAAIGLARLRLDGFVSLDAGHAAGTLLTRPITCASAQLTLNARAAAGGCATVELLDESLRPIPGFERTACIPFTGDSVRHSVQWQRHAGLARLEGARVRVRVTLKNAEIYALTL